MTRLRVSVADREKVGSEEEWKRAGAMGLIVKDNGVQAVYGPKADVLKSDIEDLLRSGAPIPAPVEEVVVEKETANNQTLGIRKELQTVAAGEVIDLATVNDPVFSKKMMGDGFAVIPTTGEVVAPITGKVVSIFPTKHAIGMETEEGAEVLIHMGIDTVQMDQPAFEILVTEGQTVEAGAKLAQMNLTEIKNEGKDITIMVVFTDGKVNEMILKHLGPTELGTVIGEIKL